MDSPLATTRSAHRAGPPAAPVSVERADFDHALHVVIPPGAGFSRLRPEFGRWTRESDETVVTCAAPNEFLVLATGDEPATFAAWASAADDAGGSAREVADGRVAFRVQGPAAVDLLATVCPVDLTHALPGSISRTSLAGVVTEIVVGPDGDDSFLVHADRSYSRYLRAVLDDAAGR